MKKVFICLLFGLLFLSFASCTNNNKEKNRYQMVQEFRNGLTAEDTLVMLQICDEAMEHLKAGQYELVLANLYEYTDSTHEVKPLSEATKNNYLNKFRMFPVLDYQRTGYAFQLEGCNDVRYRVTFSTAEQAGTSDAPTTHYMFNPVKVDGTWKLCVKSAEDQIDVYMR